MLACVAAEPEVTAYNAHESQQLHRHGGQSGGMHSPPPTLMPLRARMRMRVCTGVRPRPCTSPIFSCLRGGGRRGRRAREGRVVVLHSSRRSLHTCASRWACKAVCRSPANLCLSKHLPLPHPLTCTRQAPWAPAWPWPPCPRSVPGPSAVRGWGLGGGLVGRGGR